MHSIGKKFGKPSLSVSETPTYTNTSFKYPYAIYDASEGHERYNVIVFDEATEITEKSVMTKHPGVLTILETAKIPQNRESFFGKFGKKSLALLTPAFVSPVSFKSTLLTSDYISTSGIELWHGMKSLINTSKFLYKSGKGVSDSSFDTAVGVLESGEFVFLPHTQVAASSAAYVNDYSIVKTIKHDIHKFAQACAAYYKRLTKSMSGNVKNYSPQHLLDDIEKLWPPDVKGATASDIIDKFHYFHRSTFKDCGGMIQEDLILSPKQMVSLTPKVVGTPIRYLTRKVIPSLLKSSLINDDYKIGVLPLLLAVSAVVPSKDPVLQRSGLLEFVKQQTVGPDASMKSLAIVVEYLPSLMATLPEEFLDTTVLDISLNILEKASSQPAKERSESQTKMTIAILRIIVEHCERFGSSSQFGPKVIFSLSQLSIQSLRQQDATMSFNALAAVRILISRGIGSIMCYTGNDVVTANGHKGSASVSAAEKASGALLPTVDSIIRACGQAHTRMRQGTAAALYSQSPDSRILRISTECVNIIGMIVSQALVYKGSLVRIFPLSLVASLLSALHAAPSLTVLCSAMRERRVCQHVVSLLYALSNNLENPSRSVGEGIDLRFDCLEKADETTGFAASIKGTASKMSETEEKRRREVEEKVRAKARREEEVRIEREQKRKEEEERKKQWLLDESRQDEIRQKQEEERKKQDRFDRMRRMETERAEKERQQKEEMKKASLLHDLARDGAKAAQRSSYSYPKKKPETQKKKDSGVLWGDDWDDDGDWGL
ncbi:hypothetical protein ADUPG1_006684 [Aduncisulcus paluster]|uniref:Uncharacterized protein n=1 Tax=Aduncisulcus paluster TaxID=2918883 RepID=A0ABQ5KJ61_9EUKA|nr:hypothetical protein ADUPG1_006684 [Aduncisulcus paluster]